MVPRTPSAGQNGGGRPGSVADGATVRGLVCAALGLVVASTGVAVVYPVVPAAGHHFGFLAMTALVCVFVVVWLAGWTCAEAVWTRRADRPNGS